MTVASATGLLLAVTGLLTFFAGIWKNRKTAASVATDIVNSALTTMRASMDYQSVEIAELRAHVVVLVGGLAKCEDEKVVLRENAVALESRVRELESVR